LAYINPKVDIDHSSTMKTQGYKITSPRKTGRENLLYLPASAVAPHEKYIRRWVPG